ncbi:MAG: calcium-translocating P-type ATPase, SERCA-type [Candidatus Nanoarchaeia archaeon]|nr:calcium-translocating P-type ATPase, SERCA-type [Candidatus Nanoarchaeia archaeon]
MLKTSEKGLSDKEAVARLEKYGKNVLKEGKKTTPLKIFLSQFKSVMIWVLIVAALISGFVGELIDTIAIISIVVINAILGFVQEYRAEKSIEAIKKMTAPKAIVVREGIEKEIDARELVPGDVIVIEAGAKIPADARIIKAINLKVDEASLTGESTPVEKYDYSIKNSAVVSERKNMMYMGTIATYGRAFAVVTTTAMKTEFGKIAGLVQSMDSEETPLQKKLNKLGKQLVYITLAICGGLFLLWSARETNWTEMFLTVISLAVAAIPEGLPAVVTISLALGIQKMAKQKAIVRKLSAVETLGSTSVICSDKTGTLTQNQMTVKKIFADGKIFNVTGEGYKPVGDILEGNKKVKAVAGLGLTLKTGVLCNNAELHRKDKEWGIIGDPTEGALIVSAEKSGFNKQVLEKEYKFVSEIPFDSKRKRMSVILKNKNKKYAFVKGATDALLSACSHVLVNGKTLKMTSEKKKDILDTNEAFGNEALRVLAMAYKEVKGNNHSVNKIEKKLVFLGLQAMIDPPRKEVKDAIKTCRDAGIKVVMITGDHKNTAIAVAQKIGLMNKRSIAITGDELEAMSDKDLEDAVEDIRVYARTSPEHKVRILEAFKKKGHIVAMTGDGVNDAPALKKADIGIAMGITGTDVTKEASEMVLADDNFATIVNAVRNGRNIYQNITNFIKLLLSANFGEIAIVTVAVIAGLPIPFLPIQLLWLNLITDGLPAVALSVDPPEKDIMKRKPRKTNENILQRIALFLIFTSVIVTITTMLAYIIEYNTTDVLEKARTIALTVLVTFELFFVLNCRSEKKSAFSSITFSNKKLILAILLSFAMHCMIIYVPFFQPIFDTAALDFFDWITVLAFSAPALFIFPKFFFRDKQKV